MLLYLNTYFMTLYITDYTFDYGLISEWWIGKDLEGGGIGLNEAQSSLID